VLVLKRYKHGARLQAWLAGATAFFAVFGVPALLAAGLTVTSTPSGLGILVVALIISGLMFVFECILGHRYHPVITPLIAVVFASALAVAWANWDTVKREGRSLLPKTATAISKDIRHARHGHLLAHGQSGHQAAVLLALVALGVVVALVFLHRRQHGPTPAPRPIMKQGVKGLPVGGLLGKVFGGSGRGGGFRNMPAGSVTGGRRASSELPAGRQG
jgi:hypothetical protein